MNDSKLWPSYYTEIYIYNELINKYGNDVTGKLNKNTNGMTSLTLKVKSNIKNKVP